MSNPNKGRARNALVGVICAGLLLLFVIRCSGDEADNTPASTAQAPLSFDTPSSKTTLPGPSPFSTLIGGEPDAEPVEPVNFGEALPKPDASWFEIPHAKGEHFKAYNSPQGTHVLATLSHTCAYDPLWNLRKPSQWGANELTAGFSNGSSMLWQRYSYGRYPALHESSGANWDVPHSPFRYQNEIYWLRFRLDPEASPRIFTSLENATGQEIAKLRNLADSPRIRPGEGGILFRVFPESDQRSELHYLSMTSDTPEHTFTFGDADDDYVSRPLWLDENHFVVIQAQALPDLRFYDGHVVLITLEGDDISRSTVLDEGLYPVDSVSEALIYDPQRRELFVRSKQGIRVFSKGPTFSSSPDTTYSVDAPASLFICEEGAAIVSNNEIMLRDKAGKLVSSKVYLPFVPKALTDLGGGLLLLLGDGPTENDAPGKGFEFTLARFNPDKGIVILSDTQSVRGQLPDASWVADNSLYVKRIQYAIDEGKLDNTCLIYDFDIKVESANIKNKKGTLIELYQSRPREMIRTEDDFSGNWIIKSYNGEEAFLSTDASKAFTPSRGDLADKLTTQLQVRKLLLINDVTSPQREGLVCLGAEKRRHPVTQKLYSTWIYARTNIDGSSALYWFDRAGADHNLVCAELLFALGDDEARKVQLWFSDFRELPDLAPHNSEEAIRTPGKVHAYEVAQQGKQGRLVFEATFQSDIERTTYHEGRFKLRSGYNLQELDSSDFDQSYPID